jgi:hypothetical protein
VRQRQRLSKGSLRLDNFIEIHQANTEERSRQ